MRSRIPYAAGRKAAAVIGLALFAVVLFSALYIAYETGHDCSGADCPVCAFIRQCEEILRQFGTAVPVLVSAAVPVLFALFCGQDAVRTCFQETPVSRKVRMND